MVRSIIPIEGERKGALVDIVEESDDFWRLYDRFEEEAFGLEVDGVAEIQYENGETRSVVSFLSIKEEVGEIAGVVGLLQEKDIEQVVGSIDYYQEETIQESMLFWVQDERVHSRSVSGSSLTRPSSSMGGPACQLCLILYKTARYAVQNGTKLPSNLTVSYLCTAARRSIINQLGAASYQNHCTAEAQQVIPYVQNHGVSRAPQSVCKSIGSCP